MSYTIKGTKPAEADYTPYGAALEAMYARDPEVILWGPAETGKTLLWCWKLHIVMSKYAGAQCAMVRKTYKSMPGSVLLTFGKVIKPAVEAGVVTPLGGTRPERYQYANGSALWVGGMDNPDKVLSSERDLIYVNQAEELKLDDWEKLTTRATGRGAVMPYTQVGGDANPAGSRHWILERSKAGSLRLLRSRHQDNPTLYDADGNLTAQGERTMATLGALTGVRHKRLFLGQWATAEGAVYDMFDADVHVVERDLQEFHRFYLAEDEGYTNPAVVLLVGEDSDGRLHVLREFYERGKLQDDVVTYTAQLAHETKQASRYKNNVTAVVDAAAAGLIAALKNAGVRAVGAKGRVLDGIQAVQNRLLLQGDGKPRLTVAPECVETINEFESYTWKPDKDEPVKDNDHAMDALRYLVTTLGDVISWNSIRELGAVEDYVSPFA